MLKRLKLLITGRVQGVGFRPFLTKQAQQYGLSGFVRNLSQGVDLEIQGERSRILQFIRGLKSELPPHAIITGVRWRTLPVLEQETGLTILRSETTGAATVSLPPDLATCEKCLAEISDPSDRRYKYPFTNCTNCGPRFTVVRSLPYDRQATTMADFVMCESCRREYETPPDRRFHAQPNACPICGPQLILLQPQPDGRLLPVPDKDPLETATHALRSGKVVAVKGLGGFHLACDATCEIAVQRIRNAKGREAKPLAVLCNDLERVREICKVGPEDASLLTAGSHPIVILRRLPRPKQKLAESVAPGQASLGVMLPYTPLHYLLSNMQTGPLVMTSANRSEEPIAVTEDELDPELVAKIDLVLTHNRPIQARCDDSVAIAWPRTIIIRRSRGYVPDPVTICSVGKEALGIGADYKNTACFTRNDAAYLTQHIGNLDDLPSRNAAKEAIDHLGSLFGFEPQVVGCDLHPEYQSRQFAYSLGLPVVELQHHYAHVAACMAENRVEGPVIGVAFDGTGYGLDGTIWGGEFFVADYLQCTRWAALRPVGMPGQERAVREPWRMAVAYLHDAYGSEWPDFPQAKALEERGADLLLPLLQQQIRVTRTTSAGRLFDGVASLLGLAEVVSYEGEAAMALESLARQTDGDDVYAVEPVSTTPPYFLDLRPMIRAMVTDLRREKSRVEIAARFHRTLAMGIGQTCRQIKKATGISKVALSGGVFQNELLLDKTIRLLQEAGFAVYYHQRVPPNDGGIALGQAVLAGKRITI